MVLFMYSVLAYIYIYLLILLVCLLYCIKAGYKLIPEKTHKLVLLQYRNFLCHNYVIEVCHDMNFVEDSEEDMCLVKLKQWYF